MARTLLERDAELATLAAALDDVAHGSGTAVLVAGEAGIGKTSLVRAFLESLPTGTRVLVGACDDLRTPRTLGPLRDAAAGLDGPLARALEQGAPWEAVLTALLDELGQPQPTVLVVEDLHWADDATLDVLRFVGRRLDRLRAMLLLTYRHDEVPAAHPMRALLGELAGRSVRRITPARLSPEAVARMVSGADIQAASLHAVTGGNPFFVTEALLAPGDDVPATVVDAVMARLRHLDARSHAALEQLSVVPGHVELPLAAALLGDLGVLADVERRRLVVVTDGGVAFRHELARRALERSLPQVRRLALNRAVCEALRALPRPDLSRLVHHAVEAGDVETVTAAAPAAAREAARAGSHRQALSHYEAVLPHVGLLAEAERARVLEGYGWELYNAHHFARAADVTAEAVALREGLDDPAALGQALISLSRHSYMAARLAPAWTAMDRAVDVLAGRADHAEAEAMAYRGALLTLTERRQEALGQLVAARELAVRVGAQDVVALCLNYEASTRIELGDPSAVALLRDSLEVASRAGRQEYVARAYVNLATALLTVGSLEEAAAVQEAGLAFTDRHDFRSHGYNLRAQQAWLLVLRGRWDEAEAILVALLDEVEDAGVLDRLTRSVLGRLRARRGDAGAEALLRQGWDNARRHGAGTSLLPAGTGLVELAWLRGDRTVPPEVLETLDALVVLEGYRRARGELLRYLARLGDPVEPFPGCPEEYAAGLRKDWRGAAAAWESIGAPYERALELVDSGDVGATLEGLAVLDQLGAAPAAAIARRRLHDLGVRRVPRGPLPATRANPRGLTGRQLDVLALMADGLTNTEIAQQLVLSTRTVDHHVSAILTKLGVPTRRDAVRAAAEMGRPAP